MSPSELCFQIILNIHF